LGCALKGSAFGRFSAISAFGQSHVWYGVVFEVRVVVPSNMGGILFVIWVKILINLVSIRDQKIASGGLHDHGVGFKTS
jgi:hypothetical protein